MMLLNRAVLNNEARNEKKNKQKHMRETETEPAYLYFL